jgi:hypothetical protein
MGTKGAQGIINSAPPCKSLRSLWLILGIMQILKRYLHAHADTEGYNIGFIEV